MRITREEAITEFKAYMESDSYVDAPSNEACLLAVNALRSVHRPEFCNESSDMMDPPNEPLTQADIDEMHFDRVWIDYGTDEYGKRDGEEGVVLYGKLYSIDTLDGAGLEDMLLDAVGRGDTLDSPSGSYKVYRRPLAEMGFGL